MNQEDIALLLEKCFEQFVTLLREQAQMAVLLRESQTAEALTQTADAIEGVDVQFHLTLMSTYKDEAREAEESC